MPVTRYIITQPHPGSGIGSNLASLAGAVWFAERTGRHVIVDWRGSAFLKDKTANYFTEFFATPAAIQNVRVLYAPHPELPGDDDTVRELGPGAARAIAGSGDPDDRYLVLKSYHGLERVGPADAADQFWRLKDFYRSIVPLPFVQQEIDRFAEAHFTNAFVVGVNLSSGNGEFDKGQLYYGRVDLQIFNAANRFLAKVERARRLALRGLPRELRGSARVFFATDAYSMYHLLKQVPNAVTRRTVFPPPGVGRVYCDYNDPGYTDRDAIVDAIVDMFLLARCQALVRNGSAFNAYAQTVTNCFNGNVRHIETLYARYWLRAATNRARRLVRRR